MERRRRDLTDQEVNVLRVKVVMGAAAAGIAAGFVLLPTGYFGPLSARVRGLFVQARSCSLSPCYSYREMTAAAVLAYGLWQHTKTGNPLVDSVAEHQPARPEAYWHYLHYMCGFCLAFIVLKI